MNNFNPTVGQPIRSIQTFLRKIAHIYKEIPMVIPDGKYGTQTYKAVSGFQRRFGMKETGNVDNDTWDKIISVYGDVSRYADEPEMVKVYPSADFVILPGEESVHLYVIKGMLNGLADYFANIEKVSGGKEYDRPSVKNVEKLQEVFGMMKNGVIEKEFWNRLAGLYAAHISRNMVDPIG
ncbi:MAG: peptidoglycan-binding domain-containing protein [Anaerovoracaceae bacterium]